MKLLDFGLAKVCEPLFAGADAREITVTMAGAPDGAIIGTPAYMSPEQARGLPVDKRTDIWAFGCVLYEMITGVAAFKGERASDVVAKIIEREPDLEALPRDASSTLRHLLRRCLRKDPRERLRDIGDARLELDESDTVAAGIPTSRNRFGRKLMVVALSLGAIAAAFNGALRLRASQSPGPAAPPVSRFSILAPIISSAYARALTISPDGARFAYVSDSGLAVRSRDRIESIDLAPRNNSALGAPFFSPDGRWIGYTDGQLLMKVPADGGSSVEIMDSGPATIGSWSDAGIVFASMRGLFRISAEGGLAEELNAGLGPSEQAMFPQVPSRKPGGALHRRPYSQQHTDPRSERPGCAY